MYKDYELVGEVPFDLYMPVAPKRGFMVDMPALASSTL